MRKRDTLLLQSVSVAVLALPAAAAPALADGGRGGGATGGAGGTDNIAGVGGTGTAGSLGGGGGGGGSGAGPGFIGAGTGGGAGGAGSGGAAGGSAGTESSDGGGGSNGAVAGDGGGGGGGAGNRFSVGNSSASVRGVFSANSGGNGGAGSGVGGGGGGGAGGAYVLGFGGFNFTASSGAALSGGAGGNGGAGGGTGVGGAGGSGGNGFDFHISVNTVTLAAGASVSGGNGGNGGVGGSGNGIAGYGGAGIFANNGTITINAGAGTKGGNAGTVSSALALGGSGIVGSNLTLASSGSITGGLNSDGTRNLAINLLGGANTLTFNNALPDVTGGIGAAGTLTFAQPTDTTLSSAVSGTGNVIKTGAGTLTLTAANGYSGGTTISGGTLQIGNGGTSGTLGTGAVINNGTLAFNRSDALTVSNVISGAGALNQLGSGTTILTGVNSYAGGTTISAGAIKAQSNTALGTGAVTVTSGGQLQVDDNVSLGNVITLNGAGASGDGALRGLIGASTVAGPISLGSASRISSDLTLNISGSITSPGFDLTTSGGLVDISGPVLLGTGSLIVDGGLTFLSGSNTFGSLQITSAGNSNARITSDLAVPATAPVTIAPTGTLQIDAPNLKIGSLSGSGNVLLSYGGKLTIGGNDTSTIYDGSFTLFHGTDPGATVTKVGAGTLTLTGDAFLDEYVYAVPEYAGTIVNGGTLQIGNGGTTGNLFGPVTIGAGATFAINRSDFVTLLNPLSGPGRFLQAGTGTTTITTEQLYTGGTIISAGTLQVGGGGTSGSIVGDVSISAGGTLAFNRSDAVTFSGAISGGGDLSQGGLNTLTLTGTNTYSGDTTIFTGSTLQIGAGGGTGTIGTGPIQNEGALIFDRTGTLSVPGAISGAGSLTQRGAGTTILSGINTYTGSTTIDAGTLVVNGSIANSAVTINAGGRLGGSGMVGSTTVNGTLSPGNSPGTLSVGGNLTFGAGSTYVAEVQGPVADRINVTGTASLAGTLRIVPLGGPYTFATPYTLLSAAGGRTGTFGTVDTSASFGAGVTSAISYDPTRVLLTLNAAPLVPLLNVTRPSNAASVGTGLDRAVAGGADPSAFFNLYNLPAASIPGALNTLSGEVQTATSGAVQSAADRFLATLLDPLGQGRLAACLAPAGKTSAGTAGKREACDPTKQVVSVWGAAYGGDRRVGGSAATGAATRHDQVWGLATGLDIRLDHDTLVGVAASGGGANASLALGRGSSEANLGQIGVHGLKRLGPLDLSAAFAYSFAGARTRRTVSLFGSDKLVTRPDVDGFSGRIEAAYQFASLQQIALSGVAAFQAQSFERDASLERPVAGVNPAALTVQGNSALTARTELGLKAEYRSGDVTALLRAAWGHYEARDASSTASFTALAGSAFRITGARLDTDAALVGAGLSYSVSDRLTVGGRFDGEFSKRILGLAGSANLTYRF